MIALFKHTICCLQFFVMAAAPASAAVFEADLLFLMTDTILPVHESKTDSVIQRVISQKNEKPIDKDVAIIHDLTRFGFKDLFTAFNYDPGIPYSSQVNPQAEVYMNTYLQQHGKYLQSIKKDGMLYFNLIDNIFKQYGLPTELKYLAVIESGLKTSATSWVGAAGPWQFMPATARHYGLIVGKQLDERRDYYKSTHAAAKLLLQLYQQYHDWLLVIAAYNGGGGRVDRAIRQTGSVNFWKLQHYLPEESKNHVKKFIATHFVMENQQMQWENNTAGNEPPLSEAEKNQTDTITIKGKYLSPIIIQQLSMESSHFIKLNPDFDEVIQQNGVYRMRLPNDKLEQFKKYRQQILGACMQAHIQGRL